MVFWVSDDVMECQMVQGVSYDVIKYAMADGVLKWQMVSGGV